MPKAKPDQVIVHRIELQEKERELARAAIAGNYVKGLSGAFGVVAASYIGYKGAKAAYQWGEDEIEKLWDKTILSTENRQKFREANPSMNTSPSETGDSLVRTFHFWTGGIFL